MGGQVSTEGVHVVVVGGGFGGIAAAQDLKYRGFSFTLIDMRDAFHHNLGALRAAVQPGIMSTPVQPVHTCSPVSSKSSFWYLYYLHFKMTSSTVILLSCCVCWFYSRFMLFLHILILKKLVLCCVQALLRRPSSRTPRRLARASFRVGWSSSTQTGSWWSWREGGWGPQQLPVELLLQHEEEVKLQLNLCRLCRRRSSTPTSSCALAPTGRSPGSSTRWRRIRRRSRSTRTSSERFDPGFTAVCLEVIVI